MPAVEPPPPQRGRTAGERGSDASVPEQQAAAATSMGRRAALMAKPSYLLSQAAGYPVVIKQFLQFCLVIVYPAWLFFVLVCWAVYGVFWLAFLPLRMVMKRKDPEAYAASQRK